MNRYRQMSASNELKVEYPKSEDDSTPSDSGTFYLEYELDSKRVDECFTTLDGV